MHTVLFQGQNMDIHVICEQEMVHWGLPVGVSINHSEPRPGPMMDINASMGDAGKSYFLPSSLPPLLLLPVVDSKAN